MSCFPSRESGCFAGKKGLMCCGCALSVPRASQSVRTCCGGKREWDEQDLWSEDFVTQLFLWLILLACTGSDSSWGNLLWLQALPPSWAPEVPEGSVGSRSHSALALQPRTAALLPHPQHGYIQLCPLSLPTAGRSKYWNSLRTFQAVHWRISEALVVWARVADKITTEAAVSTEWVQCSVVNSVLLIPSNPLFSCTLFLLYSYS